MKFKITTFLFITLIMNLAVAQRQDKIVVYQIFTRLFTNQNVSNNFNGTLQQNGTTKFSDINENALKSLRELGASHIWYTGVIEHATMTDFSEFGIKADHPQVVKGIAGSPYAIKDYYDVNPYLASNVNDRMKEFEALVKRTHDLGLQVLIDFVPNHVARQYKSDVKPEGIQDFGEKDEKSGSFSNQNNFYYLKDALQLPSDIKPPVEFSENYTENPAKATGNDVFSAQPNINDWFETIKLNYGVDYLDNRSRHFNPIPDTWKKMYEILEYWSKKGVDGFRCDMAEMVPVEFWGWVIPKIKAKYPNTIFIAEIYNPGEYANYIFNGKFDYLYDKVGLYDALRRLIEGHGNAMDITNVWQKESGDFANHMLRFLENHDEQRIASDFFGKNPESAFAAWMLSATLHTGPVMVYFGQELGVKPDKAEGFQGNDGRTTIFDYWGLPELQDWISDGKFEIKNLKPEQKAIRDFYKKTLYFSLSNAAIAYGEFHDLQYLNNNLEYNPNKTYAYLRFIQGQMLLFVYNFDKNNTLNSEIRLPVDLLTVSFPGKKVIKATQKFEVKEKHRIKINSEDVKLESISVAPNSFKIFELK